MPAVSIVLPSYSGSKYIRESINSILSQTFIDWELIIVNDCSTDNTLDIARKYAAKDDRITVINNEVNQKLPASLNIGFRQAKGKYLTWTSDDNIYKPEALKEMYEFLECNPNYKMVCCDMETIDSVGNVIGVRDNFSSVYMHYNNCVGACFMYHREVLGTVGEYTIGKFCVEDYVYWLRIMRYYGNIGRVPKKLYSYRVHDGSLSATKRILIRKQLLKLWNENLEWHVKGLLGRKDLLWNMYYAFFSVETTVDMERVKRIFSQYLPLDELYDNQIIGNAQFAIYGAGHYGRICREILGNKVSCFIDNNETLRGKCIDGLQVLHGSQLSNIGDNYSIIIAVAPHNIWDIYSCLDEYNRRRTIVCYNIIGKEIYMFDT